MYRKQKRICLLMKVAWAEWHGTFGFVLEIINTQRGTPNMLHFLWSWKVHCRIRMIPPVGGIRGLRQSSSSHDTLFP